MKLLRFVFVLEAIIAYRRVPFEHVDKKRPVLSGLLFVFLVFLFKQIWQKSRHKKTKAFTLVFLHLYSRRDLNPHGRKWPLDFKYYPFGADKIRIKFPETEKVGLTIEEIREIEGLDNLSKPENHARNVWLFSFYLAGIRVGDVLQIRWSDIYDDRLHYRMNKNNKLLSLKLPEKLLPILKQYEEGKRGDMDFIFPEMKKANMDSYEDVYAKTNTATKKLNRYLKSIAKKAKIEKLLTMHIARHSFGNIAGDKISIQMLQKLYRHSSITTTINYQANFMHKDTDEALEKVMNF